MNGAAMDGRFLIFAIRDDRTSNESLVQSF